MCESGPAVHLLDGPHSTRAGANIKVEIVGHDAARHFVKRGQDPYLVEKASDSVAGEHCKAVLGRLSEPRVKSSTDIADSRVAACRGSGAGTKAGRFRYRDDPQELFESDARVLKASLNTHEVVEVENPIRDTHRNLG